MTEPPRPPWDDPPEQPPTPPSLSKPDPMSVPPPYSQPDPMSVPPPYSQPPQETPFASADDKTFALIAHFGGAVGSLMTLGVLGFVGPLIAYLAKGQQSAAVRAHAVAALNFQLVWSIGAFIVFFPGMCFFFIPNLIIMGVQIAFGVIAGFKANEGQLYPYPLSLSFVK